MTAADARDITRQAIAAAADPAQVEALMARWYAAIRAAAEKGQDRCFVEAASGPATEECYHRLLEGEYFVEGSQPGAAPGTLAYEVSW